MSRMPVLPRSRVQWAPRAHCTRSKEGGLVCEDLVGTGCPPYETQHARSIVMRTLQKYD